jgi:hypothetical protein
MKNLKTFESFVNEAYAEKQVNDLLNMYPISLSIKRDKISVVYSGWDLGYDDGKYHKITWNPEDKSVESGAYKDRRCTKFVTASNWSEDVTSLEDFADIVNGKAKGDWN